MDSLEKEIRHFAFSDTGPIDRNTLGAILLEMLNRIQELEAKLKEKNNG
jgi:hypothetical protein